jgi:4-hydroxybenzoate polyprenyltransferase
MRFEKIKSLFVFLAYTNILLALGAALAAYASFILLQIPVDFVPILIIFLITFSIYSLNRIIEFEDDRINHPSRSDFTEEHMDWLIAFSLIAYIIAIIFSVLRNLETFLISLLPMIIMLLYSIKWTPRTVRDKFGRLKDLLLIKNMAVSLTWAAMIFVIIFYTSSSITLSTLTVFLFLFIRFLINVIVFDVRDIKGDKIYNVTTIPVYLGLYKTKILLYILNTILGLFLIASVFLGWLPPSAHVINISTLYGYFYIYRIGKNNIRFLCDVIVDGEYFVIGFLAFVSVLMGL